MLFGETCKLLILWSGRRGSNPRRPAWEAGILPLNYSRVPVFTATSLYCKGLAGFRPVHTVAAIHPEPWGLIAKWTVKRTVHSSAKPRLSPHSPYISTCFPATSRQPQHIITGRHPA